MVFYKMCISPFSKSISILPRSGENGRERVRKKVDGSMPASVVVNQKEQRKLTEDEKPAVEKSVSNLRHLQVILTDSNITIECTATAVDGGGYG